MVRKEKELMRSRLMQKPPFQFATPLPHPMFHEAAVHTKGERASDRGGKVRCLRPSHVYSSEPLCEGWLVLLVPILTESLTPIV